MMIQTTTANRIIIQQLSWLRGPTKGQSRQLVVISTLLQGCFIMFMVHFNCFNSLSIHRRRFPVWYRFREVTKAYKFIGISDSNKVSISFIISLDNFNKIFIYIKSPKWRTAPSRWISLQNALSLKLWESRL